METRDPSVRPALRDGQETPTLAVWMRGLGALIDLRANVALRWLCRTSGPAVRRPGLVLVR